MIPVWSNDHVLALEQTIKTLRAERDEARRLVCAHISSEQALVGMGQQTLEQVAECRGWDCFKEDTND